MVYDRKDRYYKKAKESGFRSRAAYKLMDIQRKFQILRKGLFVVDLGCAPGSWMQVVAREIGPSGKVFGIDLEFVPPFPEKNTSFIKGNINDEAVRQKLMSELGRKVDLVVSDMSPHLSGVKFQDHYNSYELAEQALSVCKSLLKEGGDFVAKIFPGEELETYKKHLRLFFETIKPFIPDATRKTSTEMYLVAKKFKGDLPQTTY